MSSTDELAGNFIDDIVTNDLQQGKYEEIITRFPPEPNGYLHLGHASSICLNFGLTQKHKGYTNLRFDDTNPSTEDENFVESIKHDIQWLGFHYKNLYYASDYFDTLYNYAVKLINKGLAYVDDLSADEMALYKGTPTQQGTDSPYRNRTVAENLDLFEQMKNGAFADGSKTLRAKIDMAHTNMLMRDPILYRIKHESHFRTGHKWVIYPMYDFAHGQSDSIENITHSICTLEFAPHRELYDWLIEQLEIYPSKQYEFARRNISYTVMSKRKLLQLVNEKIVAGWDDPRMPTISGMRRRGFTPKSIVNFCERIGIGKRDNVVDFSLLEFCLREDLNLTAQRAMAVLDPVKLIITNYPDGAVEQVTIENGPEASAGSREVPFSKELWIEREDYSDNPPKKWFRLAIGKSVRLKSAYIVTCDSVDRNEFGDVITIYCTYAPNSKSGNDTSGIPVKGTIHWVSAPHAGTAEVRLYDRLFKVADPSAADGNLEDYINPNSLEVTTAYVEPMLLQTKPQDRFQFLRKGYFCTDYDSSADKVIFNRTTTLKDTWDKKDKD